MTKFLKRKSDGQAFPIKVKANRDSGSPTYVGRVNPKQFKLKDEADFYDNLWVTNKGVFYRGTAGGKGLGFAELGSGRYVTWDKKMAEAFAVLSKEKYGGKIKVETIKLDRNLKLLDAQSKTMSNIKRSLGVKPFDEVSDKVFSFALAREIKAKGYDGVISDDVADGIVIFKK